MIENPEILGSTIHMDRPITCPGCKRELDAGTCVSHPKSVPNVGDYSVCQYCMRLAKFAMVAGYIDLVELTDEEYATIPPLALNEIASLQSSTQ